MLNTQHSLKQHYSFLKGTLMLEVESSDWPFLSKITSPPLASLVWRLKSSLPGFLNGTGFALVDLPEDYWVLGVCQVSL